MLKARANSQKRNPFPHKQVYTTDTGPFELIRITLLASLSASLQGIEPDRIVVPA